MAAMLVGDDGRAALTASALLAAMQQRRDSNAMQWRCARAEVLGGWRCLMGWAVAAANGLMMMSMSMLPANNVDVALMGS